MPGQKRKLSRAEKKLSNAGKHREIYRNQEQ